MEKTYQNNCKHARDSILAIIREMQNNIGYYANLKKHQAYQEIYDAIVKRHGNISEDWKE